MGTQPPPVWYPRRCQRCKEVVPPDKGMVHCATAQCAGATYHTRCWEQHPCQVERREREARDA